MCAHPADEPTAGPVCTEGAGKKRKCRLKQQPSCKQLQGGNSANGWYLVVEHEQKGAFNIHIARPFDLETVGLLSGGHSMPLKDQIK